MSSRCGATLEVAEPLQVADQLPDRLLADPGVSCCDSDRRAVFLQVRQQRDQTRRQVVTSKSKLGSGASLKVSPYTAYRLCNTGDVPAQWLVITPANVEFTTANGDPIEPIWARA